MRYPNNDRNGMPIDQLNAILEPSLVMRVGVPHQGGRLAFHAFNEGFPVMVSANAFWNRSQQLFRMPSATDLTECDLALDSGGYTAMQLWKSMGTQRGIAGVFPWTYEEYVQFASEVSPAWWSQPDMCCEPTIATSQEEVDYRVNATATLLEGTLRVVYAWQNELAKTCNARVVANMLKPPVPVLQGWTADDYLRSLEMMQMVWSRWEPWLSPPALIGIGSVCRRSLNHPEHGLLAILSQLEGRLPKGSRLHLFGVKGEALSHLKHLHWVASADSMAYDFSARMNSLRSGVSNTIERRATEMSKWMHSAHERMRPHEGAYHQAGSHM